jgi:hypothetical protein
MPFFMAVRVTARIAAFMPGASPPLVNTPIFFIAATFPLFYYDKHNFTPFARKRQGFFMKIRFCSLLLYILPIEKSGRTRYNLPVGKKYITRGATN